MKLKTLELQISTLVLLLEVVAQDHDSPPARTWCGRTSTGRAGVDFIIT
jgi:hypothetical protein